MIVTTTIGDDHLIVPVPSRREAAETGYSTVGTHMFGSGFAAVEKAGIDDV
ncbi:hypothetical protein [Saccharomonospora xinjiangensis]|uniref:hypothetical protein n=1 Tax=Saccharomonospora xinjiangensis TaxID=75294 RepID=UPI00142F402D|nr:hypothetical protein [Saccharomonospora xinjiangensis]